jgi:endonuclease/exonuclease/phosphatase family metal-dependent hydrolase
VGQPAKQPLRRWLLRDASFVELRPQAGFFQHRVALQATVSTPWGDLVMVSTYRTRDKPDTNRTQLEFLAAQVRSWADPPGSAGSAPPSVLVAGDFNALETSPQIQGLISADGGLGWIDAYRQVHPVDPGFTCCLPNVTSDPRYPLRRRIDYLFVVPGDPVLRGVDSRLILEHPARLVGGWLWASDHLGLFAELERPP